MKEILGDIALRLDRQSDMLQDLTHQITTVISSSSSSFKDSDKNDSNKPLLLTVRLTLETIHKNIHSLQVLHRDTAHTCHQFYEQWPRHQQDPTTRTGTQSSSSSSSSSPTLTPLFCHQVGQACKEIYARHALTIETVAEIVIDVRGILGTMVEKNHSTAMPHKKENNDTWTLQQRHQGTAVRCRMASFQTIVTRFLQSRLMTQLLCDHVVDCMMMASGSGSTSSGWTRPPKPHGAISMNVNVVDLVTSASIEARHLVETNFIPLADHPQAHAPESPEPPHILILGTLSDDDDDHHHHYQPTSSAPITTTVVRPWLQYTLVELFKNSLALTMERNRRRDDESSPYYPIIVHVSETDTHVHIDLHDQGGGLWWPHPCRGDDDDNDDDDDGRKEHWFEFATRRDKWDRMDDQQTYAMVSSPIRGLGVGLALSRLHMRQFGGDLMLKERTATIEWEQGVTATLRLSKNLNIRELELS